MRAGDRTIKTLNLSANNIGDAGALTLAAILKSNTTLEVLDLSSNVIDYDGITAIAEALTDNTSLKSLHIRCRCRIECWIPHKSMRMVLKTATRLLRAVAGSR